MTLSSSQDYTHSLQRLMQRVGVPSFKALARSSGISERQLMRLRRGGLEQMRVDVLLKLSQALKVPLTELVATFSSQVEIGGEKAQMTGELEQALAEGDLALPLAQRFDAKPSAKHYADLKQEYQRLQLLLEQQRQTLWQEFQQSSIGALESWLLQWPTAAHKARENPQLPAVNLLPLLRPMEQLLQQWGVEAIVPVGAELPYDPQVHQLLEGTAQSGEPIKVRYTGYRQGDKLLYRAKVSPI